MAAAFDIAAPVSGRFTQKSFLKGIAEFAADLKATIESECDGFDTDPRASAERRARVLAPGGFRYFCQTYFPHYVKGEPSRMHDHVFRRFEEILADPDSVYEWLMAPRGEAKSTIVTQLGVLLVSVTGKKHFPVIIMASIDLAVMMLEAIKAELEFNPRLAADFPEASGKGRVWKETVVVTRNDCKIMAAGAGKKLRGMRHGPHRPDYIALDDMENDENVRSPEQRQKLDEWIDKAVIPLGPTGGKMDLFYVGTLLHYDAVLARKSKNPMWTGAKFRSVMRWPDRMDLWEKWEEILRNEGVPAADAFYARQKAVMDEGCEVSWPSVRPIGVLMKRRVLIGTAAFDSEQQNDPIDEASAVFGRITFWVNELPSWVMFGSVDPSMGKKSRRSDPSAILVGGFNRSTGVLDIVEASIRKRLPTLIIEDVINFQREYRCLAWGVETVQFQEFFATQMVAISAARGVPVPMVPIPSTAEKELRIEAMQPHVANQLIRLHPSQIVLIEQLSHWPMADHDDGPDGLEMLWTLVQKRTAMMGGFRSAPRQQSNRLADYGVGQGIRRGGRFG